MRISDILAICWRNLTRRKLRTALTAFGVVIGVCAILVMISIGLGLEQYFNEMLAGWGDLTVINVNNWSGNKTLNDAAVKEMQAIEGVDIATPFYQMEYSLMLTAKKGRYTQYGQIYGIYPEALEKLGFEVETGSTLREGDKEYSMVVGKNVNYRFRDTKKRNGYGDRVDPYPDQFGRIKDPFVDVTKDKLVMVLRAQKEGVKDIEIKPVVAGVMKESDSNWESREGIFMDINELKSLHIKYCKQNGLPKPTEFKYQDVRVKCEDVDKVAAVQAVIKDEMGFDCYSMEDSRKSLQDQARMIQMVLGGLAAISLFVAAIGIANTMVMSIIERTREIGIMKVIGAEVGNIRVMFLMEAGMIGLLGGIVGVGLSYAISYVINTFAGGMFQNMGGGAGGQVSIIPIWLVAFALIFSVLIGIIFGFLPANRAVKISALEAIKHD